MRARAFVDTNVWVYAVDDGEPHKQAQARHLLKPASDKDFVVSAQVLGEFYVTVRQKFAATLPDTEARELPDLVGMFDWDGEPAGERVEEMLARDWPTQLTARESRPERTRGI